MNLLETCHLLGKTYTLDGLALYAYAQEDTLTGWDNNQGAFPSGSLWQVEGQLLYALIRMFKPDHVLEIGTHYGCSAAHMALALERNGMGYLDAVDIWTGAGELIPANLRYRVTQYFMDATEFMKITPRHYGLVFEDGIHSIEQVKDVWSMARLTPGGWLISHDTLHATAKYEVQAGMAAAGFSPLNVLIDPSDCGLGIWRGG